MGKWVLRILAAFGIENTVQALATAYWSAIVGMISALIGQLSDIHPWGWVWIGVGAFCLVFFLFTYPRWWWMNRRTKAEEKKKNITLEPNYDEWDKSNNLNLWNAAHLWAKQEPSLYVDHPGGPAPFYQIFSELKGAVNQGELSREDLQDFISSVEDKSQVNRHTTVTRKALREYATQNRRERPEFLFPEEREGFNKDELFKKGVATLNDLAVGLERLFDRGCEIREGGDPSEWLSECVECDENITKALKVFPRYMSADYITARQRSFVFPPGNRIHSEMIFPLQRLCGKIGSLKNTATSIAKAQR